MELLSLGIGSASVHLNRNPSASVLKIENHLFLIDCGEGTQFRLKEYEVKASRIQHIFISHLHGDHFYGLIGLLSSYNMAKRTDAMHIYAPKGIQKIIEMQFEISESKLNYPIYYHDTNPSEKTCILDNTQVKVFSFPLKHRINCTGFLFVETASKRKLLVDKLPENFSTLGLKTLSNGEDFIDETSGKLYKWEEFTVEGKPQKSFAYCSDTIFDETIVDYFPNVDLLYHEATFLENEKSRAAITHHTTAAQAAIIAIKSNSKKLIIGHFSSRYKTLEGFYEEASQIFPAVELAEEGKTFIF
ncbi:MAG: ribonuclease Z [Leadbetterella sp.]